MWCVIFVLPYYHPFSTSFHGIAWGRHHKIPLVMNEDSSLHFLLVQNERRGSSMMSKADLFRIATPQYLGVLKSFPSLICRHGNVQLACGMIRWRIRGCGILNLSKPWYHLYQLVRIQVGYLSVDGTLTRLFSFDFF